MQGQGFARKRKNWHWAGTRGLTTTMTILPPLSCTISIATARYCLKISCCSLFICCYYYCYYYCCHYYCYYCCYYYHYYCCCYYWRRLRIRRHWKGKESG